MYAEQGYNNRSTKQTAYVRTKFISLFPDPGFLEIPARV